MNSKVGYRCNTARLGHVIVEGAERFGSVADRELLGEGGRFSRCPAAAVYDVRLSSETFRVLAALAVHVNRDGLCFPSTSLLARRLRCTRGNIRYHVKKLQKAGYLWVEHRKRGNGMHEVNRYYLRYPPLDNLPEPEDG